MYISYTHIDIEIAGTKTCANICIHRSADTGKASWRFFVMFVYCLMMGLAYLLRNVCCKYEEENMYTQYFRYFDRCPE